MKLIAFRLPKEVEMKLSKVSKTMGISKSELVRRAIENWLEVEAENRLRLKSIITRAVCEEIPLSRGRKSPEQCGKCIAECSPLVDKLVSIFEDYKKLI